MVMKCVSAMYVTEQGVLALDFGRDTAGQRISPMNCYAPFSGSVVYTKRP